MQHIIVENRFINEIKWNSGETSSFKLIGAIDVWRINTIALQSASSGFFSLLNDWEIAKSAKFYFNKDKLSYIISHGALRLTLSKYLQRPPSSLIFNYGVNGKPVLSDAPNLHFNISHSGECTLIAIAESEVGADVERISNDFDYSAIITDHFSEPEKEYVLSGNADRFFKLWTRKEALAKITGRGLNDNLRLLPANDGLNVASVTVVPANDNLLVSSFKLANDYCCSVAGKANISQLCFFDFNRAFYDSIVADVFPR